MLDEFLNFQSSYSRLSEVFFLKKNVSIKKGAGSKWLKIKFQNMLRTYARLRFVGKNVYLYVLEMKLGLEPGNFVFKFGKQK